MNSQYLPPQPMGNPPQGFQPPPQQQSFQNVALVAPSKTEGGLQMGGPGLPSQQLPPSAMPQPPRQFTPGQLPPVQLTPGQLPPGQLPLSQLPPSQLPPSQRPPSQNSNLGSKPGDNGHSGYQNGPTQGMQPPKSAFSSVSPSQFSQIPSGSPPSQQMPPRPGSNQPLNAQLPSNPKTMAQSPPSRIQAPGAQLPSNPKTMAQSPPSGNQASGGQLPINPNHVSQTGFETFTQSPPTNTSGNQPPQPFNNGPPTSQPLQEGLPPPGRNVLPSSQGGHPPSFNGPSPPTNPSQGGYHPPVSSNSDPSPIGGFTNSISPPTSVASFPSVGQLDDRSSMPSISNQGSNLPPPRSFNNPPQPQNANQPITNELGSQGAYQPPSNQFGGMPPSSQGTSPPTNINQTPSNQFGAVPPPNQGSLSPPNSNQPTPNQFGGMPPMQQGRMPISTSQGMPPSRFQNQSGLLPPGSLPGGQQFGPGGMGRPPVGGAPTGPPQMGQRPPQNYSQMPGQPSPRNQPFPTGGNLPPSGGNFAAPPGGQILPPQGGQFGQGSPSGQFQPAGGHFGPPGGGQFQPPGGQLPPPAGRNLGPTGQIPPLPGQVNGPNQLSNQMQGMNLGGPRQYPKNLINGENAPHMPPPLSQQNYLNGQQPPANPQQMGRPPGPGYPPMPQAPTGAAYPQAPMGGPMGGTYPQQPSYQQQQQAQQQQRKLDPDQMPNPIQVTQDDQRTRSGPFVTNQKGLMPPLVTTNFVVHDQGHASPRFIRSTMYNVPITQDIMKQTAVPFALAISPMARTLEDEYPPPIVNFGEVGPIRCIRCKAYMCPYMQFIDSGRRFQCLFCKATTDVPAEYFQHLDHTGQRMDRFERPELVLGTYEFVATADYCRNNILPKPPAFIFVIDVSYNNIKSGMVQLLCSQMKEILQNLPLDQGQERSNMRIGFITYNSSVHFYNIKGTLAAPQMMVVGDTQEMFMPLLDGFLSTPEESETVIDALMEQIPIMFGETKETETVLLPAILGGLEALKASECAGKLLVFHSSLPTAEAPGKLKNRDDRKLLGTDKERTVLTPQTQAYNQLGQDCVQAGCSVDLFVFNNSFIDVATIGQVARLSGGEVFKYTYFQADLDGDRLIRDVIMDLSRPIAFDSIMRVRTSTGIRPTDFYGHFFMSNTTDMELASIDCDKSVSVEIKHDDKLSEEEGVYLQAALLYTSVSGQRRLRIINLALKTCSQMAELYRTCDLDTLINFIAKQSCFKLLDNSPKAVKDAIVSRAAQILATYRKNCASPSSAGQLILPECMKLLPLYVNCLLKSDALSGGSDMTIDDRAFVMQAVMTMDVQTSVNHFYPRLIPLHEIDISKEQLDIPDPIRCSVEKMTDGGVYLLENGIHMFLWVGLGASPDFTQNVFGAPSAIQVDIERTSLPELDNPLSLAVRNIIDEVRMQRHRCMRLTIVRQREKLEPIFKHFLVEDRGTDGTPSYVDFLCHMHREIRNLLS